MKRKMRLLLRYGAALLLATSILAPMLWLFLMSVSSSADLARVPLEWLPRRWDFSRYAGLLSLQPGQPGALFLHALFNSLLVACGATLISLLLAIPAAFSFSRYPGRDAWLFASLAIYMVPQVAFVLPLYFILQQLTLLNTHLGLVLVYCSLILPFLTWMLKNQFDALPIDIEQAARLDGLRQWRVLLRITLPLAKPALGASALFGWLLAWDEFFYALLFTSNIQAQTLPVTIAGFTAGRATDDGLIAAVGILAAVPPLFIALWLQKTLVSGLTSGGSKG
ncbi:Inner membrane ABC transporter permease protein ycjP [Serratia entomophila]|uniref:carbohydrate ABC transporter permease n=1 Tax=Serratia entomophila TaxID=42906 RepID=UPI001F3825FC|nr:carbohydrate ABC transporter permease [Serratia entomophila]UIW20729.1 carbohydrate ABC transporter permease [Serratia entomophila]CAI0695841.1 Inner membrane ABC transporter permease protein ycjP [Serratia entomophila]CAI0724985.1 Inner membrane ABC transporter permease protein ycjP [Serratia entomophila]CAI0769403.1 Inner membrane ABC transporter permease protein ycjP [Serratia entomophila]CAI0810050.1 Inner membrane ABC transporter permease protein ycjP [Serratia entomophila]